MTTTCSSPDRTDAIPIEGTWLVDAELSHARFVAATFRGAVKVPGAFGAVSGSLVVGVDGASGVLTIDAASVGTGNRLRDRHLRGRDFFAVAEHPELRYELRSLSRGADDLVALEGDLVAAGTRTSLPLEATMQLRADRAAQIECRTRVDRIALGIRGARAMVPRAVELDVAVVLRRGA